MKDRFGMILTIILLAAASAGPATGEAPDSAGTDSPVGGVPRFVLVEVVEARFLDQSRLLRGDRVAVGYGNLEIVRVNLAERKEPVAVASVLDKGGLQRRLDTDDLGEIDVGLDLCLDR